MKPLVSGLISTFVFFGLAEVVSTYWLQRFGNALDITRSILEIDMRVGWRQRPHLNTHFLHHPLHTDEWGWRIDPLHLQRNSPQQILVLGPSSSFGWGVADSETYPSQLSKWFEKDSVDVINAGEIGYSTDQGLRLLDQVADRGLKPRLVILAYGINDLDRQRFYFQSEKSDREQLSRLTMNRSTANMLNLAFTISFLSVAFDAANWLRSFSAPPAVVSSRSVRVPPGNFEQNVGTLIEKSHAIGAKVIYLTTALHYETERMESVRNPEVYRVVREMEMYNSLIRKTSQTMGAVVGEIDEWLDARDRSTNFVDPVHFSSLGNNLIAQGLHNMILEQGLLSDSKNR